MAVISLESIFSVSSSLIGEIELDNYLNLEQSPQDGNPIELYLFNNSDLEYWLYTSSDSVVNYEGRTYTPVLIRRGDIVLDINSLKTQLEIEVEITNPMTLNWIGGPIEGVVQLTIYRYHNNSFVTYWKGYVRGVKFQRDSAIIISGLKNISLKRFGLMRKYQRNCGLSLYSNRCGISKTDSNYYVDGIINSVNGTTIDATIFSSKIDGWFLGGIFKTDTGNCLQKIVYHSDTVIRISRAISSLVAGQTFRAWAGCDHLMDTCKTKFNNKLNYGGFPYLPDKNPFSGDAVM